MNINELLITGYDGDCPVFALNITPDATGFVVVVVEKNGETMAGDIGDHAAQVLALLKELVDRLPVGLQSERFRFTSHTREP